MGLRGQANGAGERGYAMAALLVTLAIMSILMSVAMPVWRQEARREKEAELIFRGEQYARAIALFRSKNNGALPASVDVLVTGRFLRLASGAARPLMVWNHDRMMRGCVAGLHAALGGGRPSI